MLANLKHAARNNETLHIGGGEFSPAEIKRFITVFEDLLDATYRAFPYVEDCETDPAYKPGNVAREIKIINAAISAAERI